MTRNKDRQPDRPTYGWHVAGRARKPAPLFGQRLATLRRELGLTQVQLAEALGISEKLVDYYERRAPNPSLGFVKKVARFFDVSPVYFAADELPTKKKPGPRSKLDKRVDEIRKLPPKQQELVLLMIDSFLAQARKAS